MYILVSLWHITQWCNRLQITLHICNTYQILLNWETENNKLRYKSVQIDGLWGQTQLLISHLPQKLMFFKNWLNISIWNSISSVCKKEGGAKIKIVNCTFWKLASKFYIEEALTWHFRDFSIDVGCLDFICSLLLLWRQQLHLRFLVRLHFITYFIGESYVGSLQ